MVGCRPNAAVAVYRHVAQPRVRQTLRLADAPDAPGPSVKRQQPPRIRADPQCPVLGGRQGSNESRPVQRLLPPDKLSSGVLGVVQAKLRADPQPGARIAGDGPGRFVAQTLRFTPALPLVVAEPSRQARTKQPDPDRPLAVLNHRRNIVGG